MLHSTPFSFPRLQGLYLLPPIASDLLSGAEQIAEEESCCAQQEHDLHSASPWTRVKGTAVHISISFRWRLGLWDFVSQAVCRAGSRAIPVSSACRLRAYSTKASATESADVGRGSG
jgi:hypothetical protein